MKSIWVSLLVVSLLALSACGGNSKSQTAQGSGALAGNWQFAFTAPSDGSFVGGLQGGFLLQNGGSVTGSVTYAISIPGSNTPCNSGSAPITGSVSGQSVTISAVAGGQSFSLKGSLSSDGKTIMGTYDASDGAQVAGSSCGTAQSGLQWTAQAVPALTGTVQGNLHNVAGGLLQDQSFPITGTFTQGENTGNTNATVTGSLTFEGLPCLGGNQTVDLTGNISGTAVLLQMFGSNGLQLGQIGAPANTVNPSPVTYSTLSSGHNVLAGADGYQIGGKCQLEGNICLAMGGANDCTQPISVSPGIVSFPTQVVGSVPTTQTITITNTDPSGSTLQGLSLNWNPQAGYTTPFLGLSDFDGVPNFTEQDTCASSLGSTFNLAPQQSCTVTVGFAPQQGCTWLPIAGVGGVAPASCPPFVGSSVSTPPGLSAKLTVNSPKAQDTDSTFEVLVNGVGASALQPSTPELDFGSEALTEASLPQTVTFTNQGTLPVQVLPPAVAPCTNPPVGTLEMPRPVHAGDVDGIRIVQGLIQPATLNDGSSSVLYLCDQDITSLQPNFPIVADTCLGLTLAPQQSCSVTVRYVPQPGTPVLTGLDYFLQLNTLQCNPGSSQAYCEIDSGRFPVEIRANTPSPLRMSPGAGLDFPVQASGTSSTPLTITLFNDPKDPNAGPITFKGNVVLGDYSLTTTCGASLAPGSSCSLNVIFTPKKKSFDPGTITISYVGTTTNGPQTQTVYLRGTGQ